MIKIEVTDDIRNSCSQFVGAAILARVQNNAYNAELWTDINDFITTYKASHKMEDIKNNAAIKATREAYKILGKDPNRYRPSSESLCRRIIKEQSLYNVNTLVDLLNFVSMSSGYSIGGFDCDKIKGDTITLGIGKENEPYEGIGRGVLNIEFLPIYRDSEGGIGTPTSDNERTKLDLESTSLLTIINSFNGKESLEYASKKMISLLTKYANAKDIKFFYF